MTDYKLTYFDMDGGRGEPIRIALHAAGIAFEDERWSFAQFAERRHSLPFNAVPALSMDGAVVTQSNALGRYIAKMAGLYPKDPLQALYCDEVVEALEDVNHYIVQTFGLTGQELETARTELINGRLAVFLIGLAELLKRGGGQYFSDKQLTIADLKTWVLLKSLTSGNLEHVPTDIIESLVPEFVDFQSRIQSEPVVTRYYASLA